MYYPTRSVRTRQLKYIRNLAHKARLPVRVGPVRLALVAGHPEARREDDGQEVGGGLRASPAGGAGRRRARPCRGEQPGGGPEAREGAGGAAREAAGLAGEDA